MTDYPQVQQQGLRITTIFSICVCSETGQPGVARSIAARGLWVLFWPVGARPYVRLGDNPVNDQACSLAWVPASACPLGEKTPLTNTSPEVWSLNQSYMVSFKGKVGISSMHEWMGCSEVSHVISKTYTRPCGRQEIPYAFCRVLASSVATELKRRGVPDVLARICVAFLQNRSVRVFVGGRFSAPRRLECGVPQGSILGPHMWNLLMDSLLTVLDASKDKCLTARLAVGTSAGIPIVRSKLDQSEIRSCCRRNSQKEPANNEKYMHTLLDWTMLFYCYSSTEAVHSPGMGNVLKTNGKRLHQPGGLWRAGQTLLL